MVEFPTSSVRTGTGPMPHAESRLAATAAGDALPLVDLSQFVRESPPWLVSAIVHMLMMIVFGLLLARIDTKPDVMLDAGYADDPGPALNDDIQTAADAFKLDEPVFAAENLPVVDDPFSTPNVADIGPMPTLPTGVVVPGSIGELLTGRQAGMREALLHSFGGNQATEGAVAMGLKWLASRQQRDGTWSLRGPYADGTGAENVEAATALALLAFQGHGHTPDGGSKDPYTEVVARAWKALLARQDEAGKFFKEIEQTHQLYTQALCTIALSELYGMTHDEKYLEPAQRAVDYCVRIQSSNGGWRYYVGEPGDMSVTGWFVMALQSARMAGLEVPSPVFDKIGEFLDLVARGDEQGYDVGSRYAYRLRDGATLSMTAEGLLSRQFLGWRRDDPRLEAGVEYLIRNLPAWENRNAYYWYYATQVCHHMEGPAWQKWNRVMRKLLPENQVTRGPERGSWDPQGDRWGGPGYGGRLFVTCLSIYTLEVYYRHLPLYRTGLMDDGR